MRNLILIFLILQTGASGFAQSLPFRIKGEVVNWKVAEQVSLHYTVNKEEISDTVETSNGHFQFVGKVNGAVKVTLVRIFGTGKGPRDVRHLYLEGGEVTLKALDSLKRAVVVGRGVTKEYEALNNLINPFSERFIAVRMKAVLTPKGQLSPEEVNNMQTEYDALIKTIYNERLTFIKKYPSSYISLVNLKDMTGYHFNYNDIEPLYRMLSAKLRQLPEGIELGKKLAIAKVTNTGMTLPDFTSLDTLRRPLALSDVVKKGKVTMVDFWASWCAPCRKENPNVVKAFNAFHNKGFNILSVSLDKSAASWKKAIAADGMPWYHVSSFKDTEDPIVIQLGIDGIPDNFLLDADGKVVARGLRGEALYNKISEMLN